MIRALLAVALVAGPVKAQEIYFDPEFMLELQSIGLEAEAFKYATHWAANHNSAAEVVVANALIDGAGVDANPLAAIRFVCGDRAMSAFDRRRLVIKANLRMDGDAGEIARCKSSHNE